MKGRIPKDIEADDSRLLMPDMWTDLTSMQTSHHCTLIKLHDINALLEMT